VNSTKQELLSWVDRDREMLIGFLQKFIRCRTPNPPGDTIAAARHVRAVLDENGIDYRIISPHELMPNIVTTFDGGSRGRHLALNGHMDVFPVEGESAWSQAPWGGELVDGKIYGRGSADMKCGSTASIFTFIYLSRIRQQLKGKLTLSMVSDEETFGPWGARYLSEHHPEVFGDCCLNGEPSGMNTLRFGEKGPLWLRFHVQTPGAHGAYTHASKSSNMIAAEIIGELARLRDMAVPDLGNLESYITSAAAEIDGEYGVGAAAIVRKVTVNPGFIQGGVKVNMVAAGCMFEVDIRVPNGLTEKDILPRVQAIVDRYTEVTYEVIISEMPAWTPPDSEMITYVRENAKALSGIDPVPIISLGATDARLWRYKNVPAIIFGPAPRGMGSLDEHVPVEEFFHVVKCHLASAFDYLIA
jgi:succinyl-diaminopimelate desuccinylase